MIILHIVFVGFLFLVFYYIGLVSSRKVANVPTLIGFVSPIIVAHCCSLLLIYQLSNHIDLPCGSWY